MASNTLILHHAFPSRSCRILWLCKELGLEVSIVPRDFLKDPAVLREPEFLALNPNALIPVLQDGGITIRESGAIMLYLLESYGSGRLEPPKGDKAGRAAFYQYILIGETEFTQSTTAYFWHAMGLPEERRKAEVRELSKARAEDSYDILEKELTAAGGGAKRYLINDTFSAADIAVGLGITMFKLVQLLDAERYPNVVKYLDGLSERPAFKETFQPGST